MQTSQAADALERLERCIRKLSYELDGIVSVDRKRYKQCIEAHKLESSRMVRSWYFSFARPFLSMQSTWTHGTAAHVSHILRAV